MFYLVTHFYDSVTRLEMFGVKFAETLKVTLLQRQSSQLTMFSLRATNTFNHFSQIKTD